MNVAASVRREKQEHPERFCSSSTRCLWRTTKFNHETQQHEGGGPCPNHGGRYCDCEATGCPKHKAGGCRQAATNRVWIFGRLTHLCPACTNFAAEKLGNYSEENFKVLPLQTPWQKLGGA